VTSHLALLRESSRALGAPADLKAAVGDPGSDAGVPHGRLLKAFARAALADPAGLGDRARELRAAVGDEGWLEAASTVAAFEGLVRVADATGIEVDDQVYAGSAELREALDLGRFRSAANTRKDAAAIALAARYDSALDLFR
jgi:hypothetical protein